MSDPASRASVPTRWGLVALLSVVYLAIGVVQAVLVRTVSYEAFETDGPSMSPTLVDGDRFVVDKGAYGLTLPLATESSVHWADPEPGDVVVLRSPADELDIVKRVIGVAGDRIEIRDGVVHRNGRPIRAGEERPCSDRAEPPSRTCVDESIGARRWTTAASEGFGLDSMPALVVPEGTIFALGDHRDRSNDSRNPRIGMIPVERVRGRAIVIYWSERSERVGTWIP